MSEAVCVIQIKRRKRRKGRKKKDYQKKDDEFLLRGRAFSKLLDREAPARKSASAKNETARQQFNGSG